MLIFIKGYIVAKRKKAIPRKAENVLRKSLTGIQGFDEISNGGIPKHRLTLVSGGPGAGKTFFSMQFLINGVMEYQEPGLFVSFEETEEEILQDFASLKFPLTKIVESNKIVLDYVHIAYSDFSETGVYNLEGLFIRIQDAINRYKIKRIVLDTIETIFGLLKNQALIRNELRRLFKWLKEKGITAIVTAEKGLLENSISRYGLEEYVADCVIILDRRQFDDISTRRMRIIKYRGASHGGNEYPFSIDERGFHVLPLTSLKLEYIVSKSQISTGIKRLDTMLGGKGYYKGSSILITGTAGTGKSSIAAAFANSICKNGGKCIYFAFEESLSQILRNMNSLGINLERWHKSGQLKCIPIRTNQYGLEEHLVRMMNCIDEFKPDLLIADPVSNFKNVGTSSNVKMMLARLVDFIKEKQITSLFISLLMEGKNANTREAVSSLMDTWIMLRFVQSYGERNRIISIIKSRGMKNSNQMRELIFSDKGIELEDVYIEGGEPLTGTARIQQSIKNEISKIEKASVFLSRAEDLKNNQIKLKEKISRLKEEMQYIDKQMLQTKIDKDVMKNIMDEAKVKMTSSRGFDEKIKNNEKKS